MQKHALQPGFAQSLIHSAIPVAGVAGHWMSGMRRMHPNLVHSARINGDFKQARAWQTLQHPEMRNRFTGTLHAFAYHHIPFTPFGLFTRHGRIDGVQRLRPFTRYQRQITFDATTITKCTIEPLQGPAVARQHQASTGAAVQPMSQVQPLPGRACLAKRLNHATTKSGTPMHRHASRFVQDQQLIIFMDHPGGQIFDQPRRHRGISFTGAYRRYTHHIPLTQTVIRAHTPPIHPHLTLAHNSVDQAAWYAPQVAEKIIIESLTGTIRPDLDVVHLGCAPAQEVIPGQCDKAPFYNTRRATIEARPRD